jgi:hypothetical protein
VRIVSIQPVVTKRAAPLDGTLFWAPGQGEASEVQMIADVDQQIPVAHSLATSGASLYGAPYFSQHTITLANGEQQVVLLRAEANRFYVEFDLKIAYLVGDEGHTQTLVLSDHGKPFRVTGPRPGSRPNTWSYQEIFLGRTDL